MVYHHIDDGIKIRGLQMLQDGWEMPVVLAALNVSRSSMERWMAQHLLTGSVAADRVLSGRPRRLSSAVIEELRVLISEAPSLYLDELAEWVAVFHDIPISITSLHENLHAAGISVKILRKTAAQRDEAARAAYRATMAQHYTAAQLSESYARGQRYSILPALSLDGYIAIQLIPGAVNGHDFFDFVVNDVLPQMNPYPQPRSVLIMDNASIHKSDALREVIEASGMCFLVIIMGCRLSTS
ncbi:hypothetical protein FA95DRAFT_1499052 [Auriscalpium vulgare]|uniref:Uncharacterized protein n=1 Tax=Auriscalpium vulgare TaxID=40419 RepID=A0ACB8RGV2_9AGAM|nr:hypothetical protein FA95DRAFT_1499052 [Auriscalpium vulgare]